VPIYVYSIRGEKDPVTINGTVMKKENGKVIVLRDGDVIFEYAEKAAVGWRVQEAPPSVSVRFVDSKGKVVDPGWPKREPES
jgi:hypothetical protein